MLTSDDSGIVYAQMTTLFWVVAAGAPHAHHLSGAVAAREL